MRARSVLLAALVAALLLVAAVVQVLQCSPSRNELVTPAPVTLAEGTDGPSFGTRSPDPPAPAEAPSRQGADSGPTAPGSGQSRTAAFPTTGDGRLDVRVTASEDDRPLEHVRLNVRIGAAAHASAGEAAGEHGAWTDHEGRAVLTVPVGRELRLLAGPPRTSWNPTPSSASRAVQDLAPGEVREIEISLRTAGETIRLWGRAVDAEGGAPLERAMVRLVPVGVESRLVSAKTLYYMGTRYATSSLGTFWVEIPTWKDCAVMVQHAERGAVIVAPDALIRAPRTPRDVPLAPAVTLEGNIAPRGDVAQMGDVALLESNPARPLAIARVDLTDSVLHAEGCVCTLPIRVRWEAEIDAEGRFVLTELPAGMTTEVELLDESGQSMWRTTVDALAAGQTAQVGSSR